MEWAEAGFRTSHEAVDAVSSLFEEAGASGTVIEDPALINDYIHSGLWDYTDIPEQKDTSVVTVKAYFAADDSLLVANAQKGLGRVYIERGRPGKALRYLRAADEYYAAHEREELNWRKETYQYISAAQQKQQHRLGLLCGIATGVLAVGFGIWIQQRRKRKQEVPAVPGKTPTANAPELSPREREILDLLAKGYTTQQIAEALSLSAETIKWYRRKLLEKFDAANVAELISNAKESGLV